MRSVRWLRDKLRSTAPPPVFVESRRRRCVSVATVVVLLALGVAPLVGVQPSPAAALERPAQNEMRILRWNVPQKVAIAVPSSNFPVLIYPYGARAAEGISKAGCPAAVGLTSTGATLNARVAARQIDALSGSTYSELRVTDTTMWPNVILRQVGAIGVVSPSRLIVLREAFSDMSMTNICGSDVTSATWVVEACPVLHGVAGTSSCAKDPALIGYFYFVRRGGNWLIIFVYP